MPSPIGHALAGATVAWVAQAVPALRNQGPGRRWLMAGCIGLAMVSDMDIVLATHRGFSHSLGATVIVAGAVALIAWRQRWPAAALAMLAGVAFGSHVVLDWLGHDSSPPFGIMALWPVSRDYFISGVDLFADVSRRYWRPDEFIFGNLRSLAQELVILVPPALVAWFVPRRQYW